MIRIFNPRSFREGIWVLALSLPCMALVGQSSPKAILRAADSYLKQGNYRQAVTYYKRFVETGNRNEKVMERLAFSQLNTMDLAAAIMNYRSLLEENNSRNTDNLFYLGKAHHLNEEYSEALDYYKQYLASSSQKDDLHQAAVDQIKRCGVGISNSSLKQGMLVENLGKEVNSGYDDFGPVESPNVPNRIYFSSVRNITEMDQFDKKGRQTGKSKIVHCDPFVTEIEEGVWRKAEPMNVHLNTSQHEVLGDFVRDGSLAFFWRGISTGSGNWHVDTFRAEGQATSGRLWQGAPFHPNAVQMGIYFFSDSLLLFSSNRPGGFGGFDLYYSKFNGGKWTQPQNMGSEINTVFDEITPYLALDGVTIYFSSDRLSSMGDFDVFKSRFNRRSEKWERVENLGKPINSAGRDIGYQISTDGKYGYIGSDRKGGSGGLDLYSIYFYEPASEQIATFFPWFEAPSKFINIYRPEKGSAGASMIEKETFRIPVLTYMHHTKVISPDNATELDKIADFLKANPQLGLSIFSYTLPQQDKNLELFFSVQAAKQVTDYLQNKGVAHSRMFVRGFNNRYRWANSNQNMDPEDQRIEFSIFMVNSLANGLEGEHVAVSSTGFATGSYFREKMTGLTYSVQFIETSQMYKGQIINEFPENTVELVNGSDVMRYCSGMFKTYTQAQDHMSRIREFGVSRPMIVPYLDGRRLKTEDINEEILNVYPSLRDFKIQN